MKKLMSVAGIVALAAGLASAAEVTVFDCTAKAIYDTSFFEESFSMEEYPDVYMTSDPVDGRSVHVGGSLFSDAQGDIVNHVTYGSDNGVVVHQHGTETILRFVVLGKEKTGVIIAEGTGKPMKRIADLVCE